MHIPPSSPRFTTEAVPGGIRAVIPSRQNWFVILFLCAWLVGWAFGEIHAAQELLNPTENSPRLFLSAWLAGWTLGGAFALSAVLWQLGGKEVITVDLTTFEHRIEAFGIGKSKRYALAEIKNVRVAEYTPGGSSNQAAWIPPLMGPGHGPLAFDYGARTFRVGPALEEAEAKLLLEQLTPRLPRKLSEA
jgi:hypothetical protein